MAEENNGPEAKPQAAGRQLSSIQDVISSARQGGLAAMASSSSNPLRGHVSIGLTITVLMSILGLAIISFSTFVLAVFALAPSWIYFFIDAQPNRFRFQTLFSMNLAGAVPHFQDLWSADADVDRALEILMQPGAWLTIYGSCLGALLLFLISTHIMVGFLEVAATHRKESLVLRQKEIITAWGKEISQAAASAMASKNGAGPVEQAADSPLAMGPGM